MKSFWQHSVAVGSTSYLLAMRARTVSPDTAFLAGLLHDVGELLICLQRPQEARRCLLETDRRGVPNFQVEQEELGFTHSDVGGRLLETWALDPAEIASARFHHRPNAAPPASRRVVDLVHIADVTVSAMMIGNAGERAAHPLAPEAWSRSGLRSNDMTSVLGQLDRQMGSLAETIVG
jgi:HD-like signal output (HDOD) protein